MTAAIARLLLALTIAASPVAAQSPDSSRSLTPPEIESFNACVEQTYKEMEDGSVSTCSTPDHYTAASQNNRSTLTVNVPMSDAFISYYFVPGSGKVKRNDGTCTHDVTPIIANPQLFQCVLHTRGCGIGREGGHVWGACSVNIKYQIQSGDWHLVKNYCFARTLNITRNKPNTYVQGCEIQ